MSRGGQCRGARAGRRINGDKGRVGAGGAGLWQCTDAVFALGRWVLMPCVKRDSAHARGASATHTLWLLTAGFNHANPAASASRFSLCIALCCHIPTHHQCNVPERMPSVAPLLSPCLDRHTTCAITASGILQSPQAWSKRHTPEP